MLTPERFPDGRPPDPAASGRPGRGGVMAAARAMTRRLVRIQTRVLLALIYLATFPWAISLLWRDALGVRRSSTDSFWVLRDEPDSSGSRLRRMF